MNLNKYKSKRNFDITNEPEGSIKKDNLHRFVVQEHHARNLHYDFRLEMEGVLKSWAVPKNLPEKPGIKRLAVMVEDHPVEYIDFSGDIPEGEYGAGTVYIYDKGYWHLRTGDLLKGSLKFYLDGKIFQGDYALVKLKDGKNWLIYKI